MSTSTTAMASSGSMSTTGMLFERLWRTSGIQLAVLLVVAYLL